MDRESGWDRRTPDNHRGFKALPYESPSQSDDGTILAARGEKFVKLDRQGNRIGNPLSSILVGRPPYALAVGPFDPQISSDGHKLAYWIGTWSTWFDYGSSINWPEPHDAVIWQNADTGAQLGFTLNFQKPSWFQDSQHALLNQPMNRFAAQIVAGAVGANEHASTPVLKDSDALPAGEYYSQDLPIRNSRRPATSSWRCAARTRKRSVSTTCAAARR